MEGAQPGVSHSTPADHSWCLPLLVDAIEDGHSSLPDSTGRAAVLDDYDHEDAQGKHMAE